MKHNVYQCTYIPVPPGVCFLTIYVPEIFYILENCDFTTLVFSLPSPCSKP